MSVTLVISLSLIIPPAHHLFNRKQINYLLFCSAMSLLLWLLRTDKNGKKLQTLNLITCLLLKLLQHLETPAKIAAHFAQRCNTELNIHPNPKGHTQHRLLGTRREGEQAAEEGACCHRGTTSASWAHGCFWIFLCIFTQLRCTWHSMHGRGTIHFALILGWCPDTTSSML